MVYIGSSRPTRTHDETLSQKIYACVCGVCVCVHRSNLFYSGMDAEVYACLLSSSIAFSLILEPVLKKGKLAREGSCPFSINCLFLQKWEGSYFLGLESWLTGAKQAHWQRTGIGSMWRLTTNSSSRRPDTPDLSRRQAGDS